MIIFYRSVFLNPGYTLESPREFLKMFLFAQALPPDILL